MEVAESTYPATFSDDLATHCKASFIPARLFHHIAAVHNSFPRYVRLHPRLVTAWEQTESLTVVTNKDDASSDNSPDTAAYAARIAASYGLPLTAVKPVSWLPCFCYALPRSVPLRQSPLYKDNGGLVAMDAGSMAAVVALRPRRGDRVLDLCCSPGMKLNLIADAVAPGGLVLGVDISLPRLFVARAQVVRHHSAVNAETSKPHEPCVGLFAVDGCTVSADTLRAEGVLDRSARARVNVATGLTAKEERRLKNLAKRPQDRTEGDATPSETALVVYAPASVRRDLLANEWDGLFDRVLVDAECSHDGSLAHLDLSVNRSGMTARPETTKGIDNVRRMERMHIATAHTCDTTTTTKDGTSDRLHHIGCSRASLASPPDETLAQLQLRLLLNGYRQLRVGGTLVYSTCSFSFWQNEYIVHRFLQAINEAPGADSATEAVVCQPFSYAHETIEEASVAPFMALEEATARSLQVRLEQTRDDYGIVSAGSRAVGCQDPLFLGARFFPNEFETSFQFVAKITKRRKGDAV